MKLPALKTLKVITFSLLFLFFGFLITYKIQLPVSDDMARHIKNGELILHGHFEVLYANVYSYTMPEQRFINHHWLSGVIFYLLLNLVGWSGLVVFKVILLLAVFALLFRIALNRANFWLAALFSLPTIYILLIRSTLRPEIFSYFFSAIFLYTLTFMEELSWQKKIFWLIPLQLLWVNMHIFFIVGPLLVCGFLFEKIIRRTLDRNIKKKNKLSTDHQISRLTFLLFALIAVCFVNPNGVAGTFYPLNIFNNYGNNVNENSSMIVCLRTFTNEENLAYLVFCGSAILLAISFLFNTKKFSVFYFLAAIATSAAGFMVVRFCSFLGLIFLPVISFNFNEIFSRMMLFFKKLTLPKQVLAIVFILILLVIIIFKSSDIIHNSNYRGIGLSSCSEDAAAFFTKQKLKGPIFNDYDIGSYLIYNFYPREKVFVDNRPESYSASFFENILSPALNNEDMWQKTLEKYQFNTIFLYKYDLAIRPFIYRRMRDTSWALVYADLYCVIFLKNNKENKDIIELNKITANNVAQRVDYMMQSEHFDEQVSAGDIFNMLGRDDLGEETFFKVVCKWPDKGKIWMVLGQMELSYTNPKSPLLAIMYFKTAISVGYKTAEAYSLLGSAYLKMGLKEKAEDAFQAALKINPKWKDAQDQYNLIEIEKTGKNMTGTGIGTN